MNSSVKDTKLIIGPLDWGLGHATRCIPIIRKCIDLGQIPLICTSGNAENLLKEHFPELEYKTLPGISIRYPSRRSMSVSIGMQVPGILRAIKREHQHLEKIIAENKVSHVISDNRYGFYSAHARTAFIGHQLRPVCPDGIKFIEPFLHRRIGKMINRHNETWIPDLDSEKKLSGILSDTAEITNTVRYTGLLSRFSNKNLSGTSPYEIIAVLSGPEPARSQFENRVIDELSSSGKKCLVVRGLPDERSIPDGGSAIEIRNNFNEADLDALLGKETTLIARSGYSTIMDLVMLNHQKCILIPTPGQTEQEYLANYVSEYRNTHVMSQADFQLPSKVRPSDWSGLTGEQDNLGTCIERFIAK